MKKQPPPVPESHLKDEDFDFKGTTRNKYENSIFNPVCSNILQDLVYLGSDVVAQNYELLQEHKITHVINCAADYSADYHIDKGMKYLSLHLKDHVRENIESCFYAGIDFINDAKASGGRVYVHCVQGISRSTTMILSYMIYTQKTNLEDGLKFIRSIRHIANPNMNFMAQLIWFHKRLYGESFDSIPVSPRVFLVSSHQVEDPFRISCRLIMDNLY
jgi:protein-tyrosine phosphatase